MQAHLSSVVAMNLYFILGLVILGVNGEKKVNLEDIERDNLRSEGISKPGHGQPQATKYLTQPQGQQQYLIPSRYSGPTTSPIAYVTSIGSQNAPQEAYVSPSNNYLSNEQIYQHQNKIAPQQAVPIQSYTEYQQRLPLPVKGITQNVYQSQQLVYQPEVAVGNQLQGVQQKTITAKYAKAPNKDTVYVNIPMMHLLTYYPNLNLNPSKGESLAWPQFASATKNQISIPFYTSALSQKPTAPVKPTYQIQYTPKHAAVNPTTYTTKEAKGTPHNTVYTSKRYTDVPLANVATHVSPDQSYAQGRQWLYTQAYIGPSQPQYVPQIVYMHDTPVYSDIYANPAAYVQDNSVQETPKYSPAPEQLDNVTPDAEELPHHVLAQQTSQSVTQNYVKNPDELNEELPPHPYPAQQFKPEVTSLVPVPSGQDESVSVQNHVGSSEPRSLLDSYVPSKIIAAQDSARYQERPIKLESGFVPSKENFLHRKRQST